jgi:two-component system chemotaxis response regulator CheB
LHEKLLAAAGATNGRAEKVAEAKALAPKVAPPAASSVMRVDARLVIIGSSTGGPKALQAVVSQLPKNLPVPVVVAQHMPPHFTDALAKRLNETCEPEVTEVKQGEVLMPGRVYIAPGGQHLRIKPNGVSIDEDKGESPYKPSVDVLAESAREVFGKQVLAVMLTGMGNDGTREFVKLKQAGAHVIAQDQLSSVVYGMPKAVLEAGGVSEVLALEKIGMRIRTLLGV